MIILRDYLKQYTKLYNEIQKKKQKTFPELEDPASD